MHQWIENPWVTGHGPWDEPEPEVLEECTECGIEFTHGDEVYDIGDGEEFYCKDCLIESEYESGKCACCGDECEQGEKIYETKDGKKFFCQYCVSEITLDEGNYHPAYWEDERW